MANLHKEKQIESLKEMIAYLESKSKTDKLDRILIENCKRSITLLTKQ